LNSLNNSNFSVTIIRLFTEESFIYRRINQLLRNRDYTSLLSLKYYNISLIHSLLNNQSNQKPTLLFRGLDATNEDTGEFFYLIN
jgi:hypothetical protein